MVGEIISRLPSFRRALDATDEDRRRWAAEAERRRRADEEEERRNRWEVLATELGSRYRDCRMDSFLVCANQFAERQEAVLAALMAYAKNITAEVEAGRNVLLYGTSGVGKDHLLVSLSRVAIWEGITVKWERGSRFFMRSRQAMGSGESELVHQYAAAQMLYLSDPVAPVGGLTGHQAGMLLEVLDTRYREQRPTWVSINVASRQEAEQRLGVAIIDRLGEGALTLGCEWPSYRAMRDDEP